ncbi:hypothetical protein ASE65_14790 [Sphingomonas sp. Leaf16]|nr:hypothetical protein ASE65_14790 [Sphingomonas sp. Leaf16]KQN17329.1 hypothetical protein ASE83_14770 [Sphingomonas sp. Leaf32]
MKDDDPFARTPGRDPVHDPLEQIGSEMAREPCFQPWKGLGIEPVTIDRSELPHERHDRSVGQAHLDAAKLSGSAYALFQFVQKQQAKSAMLGWIGTVTIGIFVPVEVVLEHAVVAGDQSGIVARQPVLRIVRL